MSHALPPMSAALLLSALCGACVTDAAADEAIIIGGGYSLLSSQGQIELNVQYAKDTLNASGVSTTTFFTDGANPASDVFIQHQNPLDASMEPLSRVFGDHLEQNREYRTHQIEEVVGSTRKEELLPALNSLLSSAQSPLWLLYNGHGNQSENSSDEVTIELWDKTRLTAAELHSELNASTQPLRYVFTQCFSGGFHALAYDKPHGSLTPASPQRCGFTAVSPYALSEGCSAGINTDDYRDYTTHFFAALSGYERDGEIISTEPDINKNGDVSPREAHLYTLLNAKSTDISRSTSEDFLERWEPWYLKWTPGIKDLPSNEYAKIFRELAVLNDISLDQNSVSSIRNKLNQLKNDRDDLTNLYKARLVKISKTKETIAQPIVEKWPSILGPYTVGFQKLIADGALEEINTEIQSNAAYADLVNDQDTLGDIVNDRLELDRSATQLQKMLHLRRLATLKQQLVEFGSNADNNTYNQFVQCEEAPFANAKSNR